jgi:formate/nitrite transporter
MSDPLNIKLDALLPAEIAQRASEIGVKKANLNFMNMFVLAVLAGAFISLGALFATITYTGAGAGLPYGVGRLLFGLTFGLGLILVVLAGAELFTGNALITIAWASGKVSFGALARNWAIVYFGNFVGSVLTAVIVFLANEQRAGGGAVGAMALSIANSKTQIAFLPAVASGILCNALVCLAVWLTLGARTSADKILAIIFPITAFVAAGFEHSVANMYFIPSGLLIKTFDPMLAASLNLDLHSLTVGGFISNLIPVTIGNIIGGGIMVALVYWFVYLREKHT